MKSSLTATMRLLLFISLTLFGCESFSPSTGQRHASFLDLVGGSNKRQSMTELKDSCIGKVAFLVADDAATTPSLFGSPSPVENPSIMEVAKHLCQKASWYADGQVDCDVVPMSSLEQRFETLATTDVVLALGLQSQSDIESANRLFQVRREHNDELGKKLCHFSLDCAKELPALVGPFDEVNPSILSQLVPWSTDATARRLFEQMTKLLGRHTSDDVCFAIMVFLNQFSGHQVDWVKHSIDATWEKGPVRNAQELYSMVSKCGDCIGACVQDETCRECIGKLTSIDSRDQVESYRTIVSFESDLLRDFSLCILTKNNIFNCDAEIPKLPVVKPISSWRGVPLTEEAARSILVGHLNDASAPQGSLKLDISWKVACGANQAYDLFPSQNQLFYPAARGRDMWYDPVFRVETLDGRNVWCKRHYKVRPAETPGTFRLSVLDNGVTSNEFWTIVGVADDLSWIVFHYAGAASAVGQRYLGGLLCTPDGSMPPKEKLPEIWRCFQSAGIQPWELYKVNNDENAPGAIDAGPPPLDFYRADVLARRAAAAAAA